jgi:hypothetical protein
VGLNRRKLGSWRGEIAHKGDTGTLAPSSWSLCFSAAIWSHHAVLLCHRPKITELRDHRLKPQAQINLSFLKVGCLRYFVIVTEN